MRRTIILAIIIPLIILAYGNNYEDAYDYTYQVARYYGVSQSRAHLIARTVAEEYEHLPSVPYQIFVALIVSESNFRNVFGDSGNAVGYCQLHESAVWYVAAFDPNIKKLTSHIKHKELIKFPELQIRIGYRYLYLIMKNLVNWNIIDALNYWNNSDRYYIRVFDTLSFINTVIFESK